MWIILRIIFGACLAYVIHGAWENGQANPMYGDMANAGFVALAVVFAVANAIVWAPYLGEKLSEPLTGVITKSTYYERKNYLLRLVYWLQDHGFRRLTVFFCFLEGIHNPNRPTAFVVGLKNSKAGSWFEKVYAEEVFKFDNIQNCILAYEALKRHNIMPPRHHNPEVNLVFVSLDRSVKPEPAKLQIPAVSETPTIKRNRRIRLFDGQDDRPTEEEHAQLAWSAATAWSSPDAHSSAYLNNQSDLHRGRDWRQMGARWCNRVIEFLQGK